MEKRIEYTDDGSATLFVPELNEHYHSVKGARTESRHIFIDMGLKHSLNPDPHVLEIGFGTGLNAYLTLLTAYELSRRVHYTGIELYPLNWEIIKELSYSNDLFFQQLHTTPWEEEVKITPFFTLLKKNVDFAQINLISCPENHYDVVYFDAFAPEKQPGMWQQQLFEYLYVIIKSDGILTTYCAKGTVRRALQQAGFMVERLPGPPGGKREILRATKKI